MRHVIKFVVLAVFAYSTYMALPTTFHEVSKAEASYVMGGACVAKDTSKAYYFCTDWFCWTGGRSYMYAFHGMAGNTHKDVQSYCPCDPNGPTTDDTMKGCTVYVNSSM